MPRYARFYQELESVIHQSVLNRTIKVWRRGQKPHEIVIVRGEVSCLFKESLRDNRDGAVARAGSGDIYS